MSILVVMGYGLIIGILAAALMFRSQNQNTLSKRFSLNEQALLHAKSAANIIFAGLNNSLNYSNDNSFYYYLTRGPGASTKETKLKLDEEKLISFLFEEDRAAYNQLKKLISPDKLSIQAVLTFSYLNEENPLQDNVEKRMTISLLSIVNSYGIPVKYSRSQKILVYNLLPPLSSKFTFYHKSPIKNNYNRFKTDQNGFPLLPAGVNYSRPLLLFNSPIEKTDKIIELLESSSSNLKGIGSIPNFASTNILEDSKKAGFLFFGDGYQHDDDFHYSENSDLNVLRLTSGKIPEGYGELSQLYPSSEIKYAPTTFIRLPEDHPPRFQETFITSNFFKDSTVKLTTGKAFVHSLYDGFYENNPYANYFKNHSSMPTDSNNSSLIHPFGTISIPSPAYTVGSAYRSWMRYAWIEYDRVEEDSDEQDLKNRLGSKTPISKMNARVANLCYLTEEQFLENSTDSLLEFNPELSNKWYKPESTADIEPVRLSLPDNFNAQELYPTYEQYESIMTNEVLMPMNQFLSLTTHPADNEKSKKPNLEENWVASWGLYLKGNSSDFRPDKWQKERIVYTYSSMDKLLEKKLLVEDGSFYVLNLPSHAVSLLTDLILDKPLKISGAVNLYVEGNCYFSGVKTSYLASFNCENIRFSGRPNYEDQVAFYDGFYSARNMVEKGNSLTPLIIRGGLATNKIDSSFFGMVSAVVYNTDFDPLSAPYTKYYRVRILPEISSWGQL